MNESASASEVPLFDWETTAARRPIFSVDYWPGWPSVPLEGRADWTCDLERIRAYADPVAVRGLAFSLRASDADPSLGRFAPPDLLLPNPQTLAYWRAKVQPQVAAFLEQFRRGGFRVVALTGLFAHGGEDTSPQWYHALPDWSEVQVDGRSLEDRQGRPAQMACLAHPELYQVLARFWELLEWLRDEEVLVGFHIDSEPALSRVLDVHRLGGHFSTQTLFREYLRRVDGDLDGFNATAGTTYRDFSEVSLGDDNWLVRAYAGRFRAWLPYGYYQRRAVETFRVTFPDHLASTRFQPYYNLAPWGGDLTYAAEVEADYLGLSYYPEHLIRPEADGTTAPDWFVVRYGSTVGPDGTTVPDYKRPDGTTVPDYKPRSERLGLLAVYGGLLRHTGKPLALTELGVRRSYGLSAARPEELRHLIYRGLYYRVGWFNLHSWSRKSGDGTASVPHNTFYSLNYSHHSDTLHTLRQVRDELEFIAPHATFGEPLPPPLAILVSRSSNHFPGLGGAFYGDLLYRLGEILDKPEYALYEVVEEHARGLADWLRACRGVVVVDVCLESDTRDLLDELAKGGTRLLAFGAPEYVDARYRPAPFPASYPVIGFTRFVVRHGSAVLRHLHDLTLGGSGTPDPTGLPHVAACPTIGRHPLLSGLPTVTLLHPAGLDGRRGSRFLAHLPGDPHTPVAAVRENVFYLSGLPTAVSEVKTLLRNFAAWCGLSLPEVLVSPFQRAVVVQHYQPQRERYDGTWIDSTPWVGQVRLPHRGRQQVRELRTDTPWLAYHYDGDDTVIEGVCLEPWGVKVFRKEEAPELPHFEGLPPTVAGTAFYHDPVHVVARFHVTAPTDVSARFVPGPWADAAVTWFVTPVGSGDHLAHGDPPDLRFSVDAGFDGLAGTHRPYRLGTEARPYYLVAVRRDHHTDPRCPLCREGWF